MSSSFRVIPPVTPENMSAVAAFSLSCSEARRYGSQDDAQVSSCSRVIAHAAAAR